MFDDLFRTLSEWHLADTASNHPLDPHLDLTHPAFCPSPDPHNSLAAFEIGHPEAEAAYWTHQQGDASCAVVAQASIYQSITGVAIPESAACTFAAEHGWFDPEIGTRPEQVGRLLNAWGIPTTQRYEAQLEDIAIALERGDKVIVALDANEIWHPQLDPVTGQPSEQTNAGHAVWVTGIEETADGRLQILLNDSGTPNGQMSAIAAPDFLNAWADYGNFLVVADAPNPTPWV